MRKNGGNIDKNKMPDPKNISIDPKPEPKETIDNDIAVINDELISPPQVEETGEITKEGEEKTNPTHVDEHADTKSTSPDDLPLSQVNQMEDMASGFTLYEDDDIFHVSEMPKTIHWSIPWGDLMMTMFILFSVMYIYQSANREFLSREGAGGDIGSAKGITATGTGGGGPGNATEPEKESILDFHRLSKQILSVTYLDDFASVEMSPDKAVRIVLPSELLFDTGKAKLKPRALKSLIEIAEILRNTPHMINVIGHTDNVLIHSKRFPTNWELSAIRACVVARFLIEEMKIPANRFFISGSSYFQPVKPNDTVRNRAYNRRVEIIVSKEKTFGRPGNWEDLYSTE